MAILRAAIPFTHLSRAYPTGVAPPTEVPFATGCGSPAPEQDDARHDDHNVNRISGAGDLDRDRHHAGAESGGRKASATFLGTP
jgi:hypothetical protein